MMTSAPTIISNMECFLCKEIFHHPDNCSEIIVYVDVGVTSTISVFVIVHKSCLERAGSIRNSDSTNYIGRVAWNNYAGMRLSIGQLIYEQRKYDKIYMIDVRRQSNPSRRFVCGAERLDIPDATKERLDLIYELYEAARTQK